VGNGPRLGQVQAADLKVVACRLEVLNPVVHQRGRRSEVGAHREFGLCSAGSGGRLRGGIGIWQMSTLAVCVGWGESLRVRCAGGRRSRRGTMRRDPRRNMRLKRSHISRAGASNWEEYLLCAREGGKNW
jgi:hypothetical protein